MPPPDNALGQLAMIAAYLLAIGIAYQVPRALIPEASVINAATIGGIAALEAIAYWIAFQSTAPELDPFIVAAVLTLTASGAGIITGTRTRRAARPLSPASGRGIRLRE